MELNETLEALNIFFSMPAGRILIGGGLLFVLLFGGLVWYAMRSNTRSSQDLIQLTERILQLQEGRTTRDAKIDERQVEALAGYNAILDTAQKTLNELVAATRQQGRVINRHTDTLREMRQDSSAQHAQINGTVERIHDDLTQYAGTLTVEVRGLLQIAEGLKEQNEAMLQLLETLSQGMTAEVIQQLRAEMISMREQTRILGERFEKICDEKRGTQNDV
jgi:methyl-accepting chemotaxis protein